MSEIKLDGRVARAYKETPSLWGPHAVCKVCVDRKTGNMYTELGVLGAAILLYEIATLGELHASIGFPPARAYQFETQLLELCLKNKLSSLFVLSQDCTSVEQAIELCEKLGL